MEINKILKWMLIPIGTGLMLFLGYYVYSIIILFAIFEQTYDKQDLIENYRLRKKSIYEVKRFAKSIIPKDKVITIEFESNSELFIFHISDKSGITQNWSVDLDSKKTNSLLAKLGWTKQTIYTLKEKLDEADCISIKNTEPFTIGYQRSGLGIYFYNIFDKPMSEDQKKEYNDGCTHILYNDFVALEYGGGAVGPQCFGINDKIE
ncbi:hypothetical protein DHW03_01345 [Pedobacter yonginense]|uniref:Uncharacterized protein n=1 Tax=Pedobacter yonginense TaxID=651869 RepID=A0A317ENU3_9SPHI|nr:hypothetical protein [Pedobacter yonginense]PWS28530.1 hypothetical protein DHW03_01345 [Pedobacter yonginense]